MGLGNAYPSMPSNAIGRSAGKLSCKSVSEFYARLQAFDAHISPLLMAARGPAESSAVLRLTNEIGLPFWSRSRRSAAPLTRLLSSNHAASLSCEIANEIERGYLRPGRYGPEASIKDGLQGLSATPSASFALHLSARSRLWPPWSLRPK
jgi:hypothetical protein